MGRKRKTTGVHDDAPTRLKKLKTSTSSNEQHLQETGSPGSAQILPDVEAERAQGDVLPETLQRLEKQIKNADRQIELLQRKIHAKKEEVAKLRMIPFKTPYNDSMLHLAASQHDEKAVLDLIEKGADVNVANRMGKTPLHKVISTFNGNSSLRIIKILIERGSEGGVLLNWKFSSVVPPTPSQFHDIAEFLIGRNLSELFNAMPGPLQSAVEKLDVKLETLTMLHEHGVKFEGKSLLEYAMMGNRSSTFMANLVKFGAGHRSLNRNEESVLFYAVVGDDMDALKYFLTLDLDINAVNKNRDTPLHVAIKSGSKNVLEIAQLLISNNANTKSQGRREETPLHAVAKALIYDNCSDLIRLLIDNGADAFAKDMEECTFLHYLLLNYTLLKPSRFHNIVEHLIEKECFKLFDEVDKDGRTLLHVALQNINMETSTLSMLRKQGCLELEELPDSVITGWINRIIMSGNAKALKFLVDELGLDVGLQKNVWRNTPLHQVLLYGSHNVLQEVAILIGKANVDVRNKGGQTPLDIAIERENMVDKGKVIDLLRNGIHSEYYISFADEDWGPGQAPQLGNDSPSQNAPMTTDSFTREERTSLDMVDKGNLTEGDDCENTSLTDEANAVKICKEVLQEKLAEVAKLKNDFTSLGRKIGRLLTLPETWDTELNLAINQGDEQGVMDLVQNGANVNGRDTNGNTPLHNAARCTQKISLKITKNLIDNGADMYAVNQSGLPFYFPTMTADYFQELASILAAKNADGIFNSLALPTKKFCDSARITGFQELMRKTEMSEATLSLLRNVDFNAVDEDKLQRSVLWYAVTGGRSLAMVENLVKYGANTKYLTKWNESLLFGAAEAGRVDLFRYFLSLGLDINAVNKCGNTPLHCVMKGKEGSQLELTKFLIRNGANPNLENNYGETPLHFAAARIENNETGMLVIKELLDHGAFPFSVDKNGRSFLEHLFLKISYRTPPLTPSQIDDMVQYIIAKKYTALFLQVKHTNPIFDAVRNCVLNYDTLSLLHENGLLVNVSLDLIIHSAVVGGNTEGLKILIQFRRDLNQDDGGGRTVLQEVDESIRKWSKNPRGMSKWKGPNANERKRNCCGLKCQEPLTFRCFD